MGLAEDVTAATLERMRIEHERDYDILTGLYNRQAFHRVSKSCSAIRSAGRCSPDDDGSG